MNRPAHEKQAALTAGNLVWVTDDGLKHLTVFKGLTFLDLSRTQVTDDGVIDLRRALPKCRIVK